jgi:F0F1-type ATP synthase membrane subunit c/vacuolar-type H+-ATPase subunit K
MQMNASNTVVRAGPSRSIVRLGAVAIGLALITAGCGQAKIAAPLLQSPPQAPTAVAAERPMVVAAAPDAAPDAARATFESPRVAIAGDAIASPRECAPDEGVTEACTYN